MFRDIPECSSLYRRIPSCQCLEVSVCLCDKEEEQQKDKKVIRRLKKWFMQVIKHKAGDWSHQFFVNSPLILMHSVFNCSLDLRVSLNFVFLRM